MPSPGAYARPVSQRWACRFPKRITLDDDDDDHDNDGNEGDNDDDQDGGDNNGDNGDDNNDDDDHGRLVTSLKGSHLAMTLTMMMKMDHN